MRESKCVAILDSVKLADVTASPPGDLNAPESWVSCLDSDRHENWLAVGNGTRPFFLDVSVLHRLIFGPLGMGLISLWHIGLRNATSGLPVGGCPQAVRFFDGNVPSVYHFSLRPREAPRLLSD